MVGRFTVKFFYLFFFLCKFQISLFVSLSASICLVLLLLLFFSTLRRLGDFTSRYRKKRFNSWTTQLCLWFAAFYSSTAAERTDSILWIKESIFVQIMIVGRAGNNQPTLHPHRTSVIYSLLQMNTTVSDCLVKRWLFFFLLWWKYHKHIKIPKELSEIFLH